MKVRVAVAMCVLTIVAMPLAYGQSLGTGARLSIPFNFKVGKKAMQSGKYEIVKTEGENYNLLLRNNETGKSTYVHIIERLAATSSVEKRHAKVVFDSVGDEKYLSEFWPANNEDGYLLGVTKQEQKHVVVEE